MIDSEYDIKFLTYAIIISLSFLLFWLIQALAQILNWAYWIQTKEYRFDRFKTLLKSGDGRADLGLYLILTKISLVLASLVFGFPLLFYYLLILLLSIKYLITLLRKSLRRPVLTKRAFRIVFISSLLIFAPAIYLLFFATTQTSIITVILASELLIIIGPALGVFYTGLLVSKAKETDVKAARKKLDSIKPIVIGVTGSYGKTTTKDFIYHILSYKFKTAKTPGSHNTEFGLARSIVNNLKPDDKFFVAEYGAYKIGEIKRLANIARPLVAVITAIEPQHLEIFGSIENIKKAKYELIEALPGGGIAIFNLGNKEVKKLLFRARKDRPDLRIYSYKLSDGKDNKEIDIRGRVNKNSLLVSYQNETWNLKFNFPGGLAENLLPAILIAKLNKVDWKIIEKAVSKIELPASTLNIRNTDGKIIIDDSHNSSPTGFSTAIQLLKNYKDYEKIVITPGIIELGSKSKQVHTKIAEDMKKIGVNKVLLTKKDYYPLFKSDFGDKTVLLKSTNILNKVINDRQVILLEGRVPSSVLKYFGVN